MATGLMDGEKEKLVKDIREMFAMEIRDFCQQLNHKISERLTSLTGKPQAEERKTGWLDFWHLLEHKVMASFDLELYEINEEVFNAAEYWKKGMTASEFLEKIDEAMKDFESCWEIHGADGMVIAED